MFLNADPNARVEIDTARRLMTIRFGSMRKAYKSIKANELNIIIKIVNDIILYLGIWLCITCYWVPENCPKKVHAAAFIKDLLEHSIFV